MTQIASRKIKIVRIIARLNIGGPSIHTILLSGGLDKDDFETHLLAGTPGDAEGDMSYFAKEKGVSVEYIPELKREIGFSDIRAFFKILRIIKKVKPDIVHTHTAKAGALGRLAAVFAGVPIRVHTFHGHVLEGYFNPVKAKIFIFIERCLANFTDRIIVVSESVRDEIVNRFKLTSEDKCVVIRLGLDLEKFLDSEGRAGHFRKNIGVEDDTIVVGIVGRLVSIKNHRMFFDAAKKIIDGSMGLKIKFLVIGDGELKTELKKYAAKLGIREHVVFTGWVKDTANAYKDIDIVVSTSLNEGTPVSLIEALASGKPVVATDVGGVRDVVRNGDDGFLVGSKDVDGLASRISELIGDQQKRLRFGASGKENVRKKYSRDRLIDDIETLYKSCLKNKAKSLIGLKMNAA